LLANCSAGAPSDAATNHGAGAGTGGILIGAGGLGSGGAAASGTCVTIASLGQTGHYGNNGQDTTTEFQNWLQNNSANSATLEMDTTPVPITAEFLAKFKVVVIQGLMDNVLGPTSFWTPTADEVSALQAWVEGGGGLVTMSGYTGPVQEVVPVNALLAFSGIQYNMDDIMPNCVDPTNMGKCYCWGSSDPAGGFDQTTPIGANIQQVGIFHGRSLSVPTDATVVAKTGSTVIAAMKQVGMGRVFVFADEWVTYTSQWSHPKPTDPPTPPECIGYTGADVFQVPQFWYNAFKWVSNSSCFDITVPGIIK
jgi:hypothetical protein